MAKRLFVSCAAVLALAGCQPPAEPEASQTAREWAALAQLPDWKGIWEIDWRNERGSPPRPGVKLRPEYQRRLDDYRAGQAEGRNLQTQNANCVPPGLPGIMSQPYPIEFLYQPDKVVLLTEAFMQYRHIWTDGRAHPEDPDLTFHGHSVGQWEGDTLVVETVGLREENLLVPGVGHSDQLRIVERIRRVDPDWMEIETTLIDPEVFTEPYTSTTSYKRIEGDLREYICLENNHSGADAEGRAIMHLE